MTTDRSEDVFSDTLDDPLFGGFLTELRDIADGPAPAIGPDLAAVLAGAAPHPPNRVRRPRTASTVVVGLVSAGVLAGGISAAAADALPAPVQRVVARVVNTITPFEIPERGRRDPLERVPDDDPPTQRDTSELDRGTTPPHELDHSPTPGTGGSGERPDDETGDRTAGSSGESDGGEQDVPESTEDRDRGEHGDGSNGGRDSGSDDSGGSSGESTDESTDESDDDGGDRGGSDTGGSGGTDSDGTDSDR